MADTIALARPSGTRQAPLKVRRVALTVHVVSSVAWIGVEAVFLLLGATAITTGEPGTVRAAYVSLHELGSTLLPPVAVLSLVSGIVLSLITRWGLVRHWWVLVKLVLTVAMVLVSALVLNPLVADAATYATDHPLRSLDVDGLGFSRVQILVASGMAIAALTFMTVLSIYKPWGPTPRGRRVWDETRGAKSTDRLSSAG